MHESQEQENRNLKRQQLYDSDVGYKERQKAAARAYYQSTRGKIDSDLTAEGKLLEPGTEKEVSVDGGSIQVHEVYTVPQAARALGKAVLTLKRWIKDGIVPEPVAVDTVSGWNHYTTGELQSIARILIAHDGEYTYLKKEHEATVNRLHESVAEYREANM